MKQTTRVRFAPPAVMLMALGAAVAGCAQCQGRSGPFEQTQRDAHVAVTVRVERWPSPDLVGAHGEVAIENVCDHDLVILDDPDLPEVACSPEGVAHVWYAFLNLDPVPPLEFGGRGLRWRVLAPGQSHRYAFGVWNPLQEEDQENPWYDNIGAEYYTPPDLDRKETWQPQKRPWNALEVRIGYFDFTEHPLLYPRKDPWLDPGMHVLVDGERYGLVKAQQEMVFRFSLEDKEGQVPEPHALRHYERTVRAGQVAMTASVDLWGKREIIGARGRVIIENTSSLDLEILDDYEETLPTVLCRPGGEADVFFGLTKQPAYAPDSGWETFRRRYLPPGESHCYEFNLWNPLEENPRYGNPWYEDPQSKDYIPEDKRSPWSESYDGELMEKIRFWNNLRVRVGYFDFGMGHLLYPAVDEGLLYEGIEVRLFKEPIFDMAEGASPAIVIVPKGDVSNRQVDAVAKHIKEMNLSPHVRPHVLEFQRQISVHFDLEKERSE